MYTIELPQLNMTLNAHEGETILSVLQRSMVTFDAPCGGKRRCKKCLVRVEPARDCNESKECISLAEYHNGARLACVYKISENCTVTMHDFGKNFVKKAQLMHTQHDGVAAIDVGTTTIASRVYGANKAVIDEVFLLNPQKSYGADVISRINACNEGHLQELKNAVNSAIDIAKGNAKKIIISANTTMLHIIAGVSPYSIGVAPYSPVFTDTKRCSFSEMALSGNGEAVLMPSVSGYIGADIVSGVLSSGMHESPKNSLLVDLGTNGELVLKANNKLYAASTAAGPAFEGGGISCGSCALPEAILAAKINEKNDIVFDKPQGKTICGAGLIDLLACLIKRNDIDQSGAITRGAQIEVGSITLTQKDIRELQLAKAAIFGGIKTLLKVAHISEADIDVVYLAGGFGKGINPSSAVAIGLLDGQLEHKIKAVGNSSLEGAVLCAQDEGNLLTCEKIAKSIMQVDLATDVDFFRFYTEGMSFESR